MPDTGVQRLVHQLAEARDREASVRGLLSSSSAGETERRSLVIALAQVVHERKNLEAQWHRQLMEAPSVGVSKQDALLKRSQSQRYPDKSGSVPPPADNSSSQYARVLEQDQAPAPFHSGLYSGPASSSSSPLSSLSDLRRVGAELGGPHKPPAGPAHPPTREPQIQEEAHRSPVVEATEEKEEEKAEPQQLQASQGQPLTRQLMHRDSSSNSKSLFAESAHYRTLFFSKHRTVVRVEERYVPIEVVGAGAYGIVCSAHDLKKKRKCAIKKVDNALDRRGIAKRTLRELLILRHLRGHENILELERVMRPPSDEAKDIYFVSDLYETDMASVIRSGQPLSDDHVQFFIYQVLRGLKYIHSANLIHRDLKPRNLLVNSNCDLKICDLGLCRLNHLFDRSAMSDYIATRWYRAPEIITGKGQYTAGIDMWSVGCILGELLLRKPLFPGRDEVHQLFLIRHLVSTPEETTVRLKKMMPRASDSVLDLLVKLLCLDAKGRPNAMEALRHPYLADLHEEADEPSAQPLDPTLFNFESKRTTTQTIRDLIWNEILAFNPVDTEVYPAQLVDEVSGTTKPKPKAKKKEPKKKGHSRRSSF